MCLFHLSLIPTLFSSSCQRAERLNCYDHDMSVTYALQWRFHLSYDQHCVVWERRGRGKGFGLGLVPLVVEA